MAVSAAPPSAPSPAPVPLATSNAPLNCVSNVGQVPDLPGVFRGNKLTPPAVLRPNYSPEEHASGVVPIRTRLFLCFLTLLPIAAFGESPKFEVADVHTSP